MKVHSPGAMWAAQLATGEWAEVHRGQHILTHQGRVPTPGFDIGYLTITAGGGFCIAGQAQVEADNPNRGIWEWIAGEWHHRSTDAPGAYPAIYDRLGVLHIATTAHNGSQGWRYVDEHGELITGDDTANAQRRIGATLGLSDFWEYTHLGGVVIGQGHDGCHVLIDGQRRMLEPGGTFFIRVTYEADRWGVALTKLAEGEAVRGVFTRAELAALPLVSTPQPTPEPIPIPEPVPMPPIDDQTATVARVREKYPTPLAETHAACLLEIARAIGQGAGLLRKDSGTNILLPDGTRVAQDIICFPDGQHFDCLGDGEGAATPGWSFAGMVDPARYYAVTAIPTPPPSPGPGPQPPMPASQLDRIESLLTTLAKHLGAIPR